MPHLSILGALDASQVVLNIELIAQLARPAPVGQLPRRVREGAGLFRCLRTLTSSNGDDRRDVIAIVFKGVQNRMVSGYLLCQMNLLLHGLDAPQIDPGNSLRFKLTDIGERDRVDVILT